MRPSCNAIYDKKDILESRNVSHLLPKTPKEHIRETLQKSIAIVRSQIFPIHIITGMFLIIRIILVNTDVVARHPVYEHSDSLSK